MMFRVLVKEATAAEPNPTKGCVHLGCAELHSQISTDLNSKVAQVESKLCAQAPQILGSLKTKLQISNWAA